ncbi:MAG: PBP1A family penicillin-binding protein [Gemmatimonadetes bacterium]|jgi:1A family penicillin-binding protein|nr:PBP1A family penicillin-binding protein [Gemmatimonadota bacterium]MBK6844623.1 PBP1A family penicillin-binding protein [Gemmatimonadota bacterium]
MSLRASLVARWQSLRAAFRRDPLVPLGADLRRHWRASLVVGTLVVGAVVFDAWVYSCGFNGCPTPAAIKAFQPPEGGRVLDRNGRLIGRLTLVKRVNVPLTRVPEHVRQAFIATEDRRFAAHEGIDWRGFARAVTRNVRSLDVREGFSTITMQVARNTFMAEREALQRSLGRKLIELRLARLLERHLTKDEILARYLNVIYLGNGVYGVEGASRDLFGKHIDEVTIAEGAMLAALPKGPSLYTPRRNRARAQDRRDLVLRLMREEGYLDEIGMVAARAEPLEIARREWSPAQPNESYALDAVRAVVDSVLRVSGERMSELTVHTTLDLTAQQSAERAVRTHADRIEGETSWTWEGEDHRRLQGALVALDPRTGDIRALVGGRRYERGGFNRAIAAKRQPGSAFKPFVYAAALTAGFTPATIVDDDPVSVETGRDTWTPANYGDEYRGRVTLRQALAQSANAATVRVSRAVGEGRVADRARQNGIASRLQAVPSIALGAVEVTPLELVAAYAPFANGGLRVTPRLVRRIERSDKSLLWASVVTTSPVMDPRDAFQLTSMLRSVVDEGTGRAVRAAGITGPVAGKTGTTNNGTDVWFVGYTPTMVAGVWFGYDTPHTLGDAANGGRYAAPAWADFYRRGWKERANTAAWKAPDGLIAREIDPATGLLAEEWCDSRRREWFKPGTEPTESSCEMAHDDDEWMRDVESEVGEKLADLFRRMIRRRL